MRTVRTQPRVLLALKTAFAASVAWMLAPLIPLADAEYSYYAPLGAVISMYPTLVRSVRTGVQALAGLAVGAAVAFAALALGGPSVVSVALVVGVGVLLAGIRVLGAGRDWVPITGLFVLLVGGIDADEYSVNYLAHMVLGVVVGVIVNVTIVPPLYLGTAEARLNRLRDLVAERMRDLAEWVRERPGGDHDWSEPMADLEETARSVREEVREADESRRGNPRGRNAGKKIDEEYERLRALERVLFFLRDLTDVLGGFQSADDGVGDPDPQGSDRHGSDRHGSDGRASDRQAAHAARSELSAAIEDAATLVAGDMYGDQSRDHLAAAEASLASLDSALDERAEGRPSRVAGQVAAAVSLRRIVDAARPFVA